MEDNKVFLFSVEMDVNDFAYPKDTLDFVLTINSHDWMTTAEMEEFQKIVADAGTIVRNAMIRKLKETHNEENDDEEWED